MDNITDAKIAITGGTSGLGLALVQAVAVAHGGRAEARNRSDGGADVSITLPCA